MTSKLFIALLRHKGILLKLKNSVQQLNGSTKFKRTLFNRASKITGFALLSGPANSSQPTTCKLKLITAQTLVSSHARTWQRVLIYSCRLRLLFPFMLLSVVISLGLVVQRSSNRVGLSSAKLLEACNQRPINYKYYWYIRDCHYWSSSSQRLHSRFSHITSHLPGRL